MFPLETPLKSKLKGKVQFSFLPKILIPDVYYVPKLRSNILSLGQLLEKGYEILMKNKCLWLRDLNAKLIAKVAMSRNRMLKLNIKTIEVKCLKANVQDEVWRWP